MSPAGWGLSANRRLHMEGSTLAGAIASPRAQCRLTHRLGEQPDPLALGLGPIVGANEDRPAVITCIGTSQPSMSARSGSSGLPQRRQATHSSGATPCPSGARRLFLRRRQRAAGRPCERSCCWVRGFDVEVYKCPCSGTQCSTFEMGEWNEVDRRDAPTLAQDRRGAEARGSEDATRDR